MTALGDTLFPSLSLSQGLAEDVAAGSHFLQKLRILHPIFAIALGAAVFLLCSRLRDQPKQGEDSKLPQLATTVMALIVVQWTLGMVNIWLLAPVAIQLTHLAIATLLWSLLVLLWNETRKLGPKTYS
jgi:heme A synthase